MNFHPSTGTQITFSGIKRIINLFSKFFVILFLFGILRGNPVHGCNDTKTIEAGSPISSGWVITGLYPDYPGYTGPTTHYYIKQLDGKKPDGSDCASFGQSETVVVRTMYLAPLPPDWIIKYETQTNPSYYSIKYVKGAPFRYGEEVLIWSQLPSGWASTAESYPYYSIINLNGAPFNHQETVLISSPHIDGWQIVGYVGSTHKIIQNGNQPNVVTATITSPLTNTTVGSGVVISFVGSATDSNPSATLTYSWNFGDGFTASGKTASHAFTNFGTTNALYTVKFKALDNSGASGESNRSITVTPAPKAPTILKQPSNQTTSVNSTATFTVTISGTGPFDYSWKKNGQEVSRTSNSSSTTSSYTTPPATASDNNSIYSVVIINSGGSTPSNSAILTVVTNRNPVFSSSNPKSFSSSPSFNCTIWTGINPVNYQVIASDPDGDPISYTLSPINTSFVPANITISTSGLIKWDGYAFEGFLIPAARFPTPYQFKGAVIARDSRGGSTSWPITFTYYENPLPQCAPPSTTE